MVLRQSAISAAIPAAVATLRSCARRLWIVRNGVPERALLADHAGIELWRPTGVALASLFPAERSLEDPIFVIDPLGNLMMRYERDADPRRILKDVSRLLRHSKWR